MAAAFISLLLATVSFMQVSFIRSIIYWDGIASVKQTLQSDISRLLVLLYLLQINWRRTYIQNTSYTLLMMTKRAWSLRVLKMKKSCLLMLTEISFIGRSLNKPLPSVSDFVCPWIMCISWIFIEPFVFQKETVILLWLNGFKRSSSPFSWLLGRLTIFKLC